MQARMTNPMIILPDVMPALMSFAKAMKQGNVPPTTLNLVSLRASQINGSSVCVEMRTREARMAGDTENRLFSVAAWRDAPCFNDAERAALALTEAVTRLCDRSDPVPDTLWSDVSRHFDEQALATLILTIGMVNFGNRVNATTKQIVGECECPKPRSMRR
ncbi:carboxymuconolactone decarboxylase family protein [Thalassoroseus pseudoceratinae]|uniref:carboxymuconolactone decarboxylase family protein n=1 Tax=Thalassoroseus pseudoceratinae TaxID=2713176 RepID=UPI00142314BC